MSERDGTRGRVLVLGASPNRSRFSNKAVRCYRELGYEVVPIHPTARSVEGLPAHRSIADVPGFAELLLLYVRPEIGLRLIGQAPARGVLRVFLNPGASSRELVDRVRELGMEPIEDCAIVAAGRSPAEFPDA